MIVIKGIWKEGFAYDKHTTNSIYIGDNEYGYPKFKNTYSQMGEYVNQVKYSQNIKVLPQIIELLKQNKDFKNLINSIDVIIPVPPTNKARIIQPVLEVSKEISKLFAKEIKFDIVKSTNTEQVKNIDDDEKLFQVKKSLLIDDKIDKSKSILLFDDIFDSGSTLQAITEVLIEKGFKNIKIFTLTKTKDKRN